MRTYLVTGGAGFIGSNYIHYMFRKYDNEIRIINVDVLTYAGNLENLKDIENRDNYTFIKADICDREAIEKIFAENDIDRVVHFAAESHVDRSIRNPEVFVQTNVMGTAVMLNAAKKAWELPDGTFKADKKFLHVSTDEVYGSLPDDDERKAHINEDLITYVEDRKGHDRRYAIAPDKIKSEIGWYPETMFKDGIRLTIAWFFEHEEWMKNVTSGDYQKYYSEMYK